MEKNYITEVFMKEFQEDFEEFWNGGLITRATGLKNVIGGDKKHEIRDDLLPAYFYGNLFSEIVSVNYNPGVPVKEMQTVEGLKAKGINCFEDYYKSLMDFGKNRYGEFSTNRKADDFDKKQLAYMIPFDKKFGGFNFEMLETNNKTYSHFPNLEKLFANRCQLELIPYGSQKFVPKDFKNKAVTYEYLDRLFKIIFSVKRKLVFLNGSFFYDIIKKQNYSNMKLSDKIKFKLDKSDGSETKKLYQYTVCMITYGGQTVKCIINHSLSMQGFSGHLPEQYANVIINNEFNSI